MDLEEFEILGDLDKDRNQSSPTSSKAGDALQFLDKKWYTATSRRSRWMDIIGDYAGTEPFLIDGDALLQLVLDERLLALGQEDDISFQLLHAIWWLERTLLQFLKRGAVFQIVFFEENRHLTINTGVSKWVFASRSAARALLLRHLRKIQVEVNIFDSIDDAAWLQFARSYKPMFVMTSDGGLLPEEKELLAERVLHQRLFIFQLIHLGITITLFQGIEYQDSKILCFVLEGRLNHLAYNSLPKWILHSGSAALLALNEQERSTGGDLVFDPITDEERTLAYSADQDSFLIELARLVVGNYEFHWSKELLYIFLAHLFVLQSLPIEERALPQTRLHPQLEGILLQSFLPVVFGAMQRILSYAADLDMMIDGRVLLALLFQACSEPSGTFAQYIGGDVASHVDTLWNRLQLARPDFLKFSKAFEPPTSGDLVQRHAPAPVRLLPFQNELFDDELRIVHVKVDRKPNALPANPSTVFTDVRHWHNSSKTILPSHLGGEKQKPVDERHRRKILKSEQRFMASLQRQAATLTGAAGAILERTVIVSTGSSKKATLTEKKAPHQQKGKKAKVESSKDKMLREIAERKLREQDEASTNWWSVQLGDMKKMSITQQISHLRNISRNSRCEENLMLAVEVRLYQLHLIFQEWISASDAETTSLRDQYTVSVMRLIREICSYRSITPAVWSIIGTVLSALGLSDFTTSLQASVQVTDDPKLERPLSFKFTKLVKSKTKEFLYPYMKIAEHSTEWQLRLFGEFMDRSMDSEADPKGRVPFAPDAWQRKVLDGIDDGASLLIVAPTSAGKTFISFYAMERVLRDSDDGILVYVAPTKALVTQVAAEIYARFSKALNGRSCWAVHTRDYRIHDPQNCQILVTVPEMLSIMLLSPPLANNWMPRIKRIILDEIHSIGQQERGSVWEQIILLAPCPIIGLSATIGEPETFNDWLASVQRVHGYEHRFIHHPHRYSHLRKFTYILPAQGQLQFNGFNAYQSTGGVSFLHPVSLLDGSKQTLPLDFTLEARDTLTLYQSLRRHSAGLGVDVGHLSPGVFFENRGLLRQKDVIEYEKALKEILVGLLGSNDTDNPNSLGEVLTDLRDPRLDRMPEGKLNAVPQRHEFRENLIFLLADLHLSGDLPAILFSFDRTDCEIMAKDVVDALESAEKKWRKTSSEWKRIIEGWEAWKAAQKIKEKLAEKAKKKASAEEEVRDAADTHWAASFEPSDPTPQFSFAGSNTSYSKDELDRDVRELDRWSSTPEWALRALRRGIAVHHSGMNKRYRTLIESLFRMGFIRVMIATGTLALGINAPTKTAVFCGDSPFLTALMYRQCAGRAGRRGFDLLGKVVFYGLPMDRVQRLVLSKLPSIGGTFPLTSTLILRLFNLVDGSGYGRVAVDAIRSLLRLPQISASSETGQEELLHYVRFSIDFLRRLNALDAEGRPLNLSGMASHLYYTEPSNFAFVTLLRAGVIHRICSNPDKVAAKEELVLVLCHLFGRRYLPASWAVDENRVAIIKRSPSLVVLSSLPRDARKALMAADKQILQIFEGYAVTYSSQYAERLGPERVLPLSKIEIKGDDSEEPSAFRTHLKQHAISPTVRSLFAATSGLDDDFDSVEELTRTSRQGLHLNDHAIPSFRHITAIPAKSDEFLALNAYLLDFFKHGQVAALVKANGLRRGDIWYALQDFCLVLMTIRGAIEQLVKNAVLDAATSLNQDDASEAVDSGYDSFDPGEADEDGDEADEYGLKRPAGIPDTDWAVYDVVNMVTKEFEEKFKAMWA